jgi:ADP-heptose:LPS heptosyltransferase
MRRVDAWLGIPLCLCASALRRILPRRNAEGNPRSVLVIKLSELGALVTLGPAMGSLARLVGRQNLYFLTFGESRGLLEIMDFVPRENIYILRTDSLLRFIGDGLKTLRELRRRRIDCSLDLDFFSRATALLAWLSGCRRRVGCHSYFGEGPYRGDLLTHRIKFNPHIHVSRMFEIMAQAVQTSSQDFPRIEFVPAAADRISARFQASASELASIERLLEETGAAGRNPLILLNPNISDRETIPLRKWSDENYVELAKRTLAGMPNAFLLMTGGPKEAANILRLEGIIGEARCKSVAGKTTLRELLALYDRADVIVTNDSGPAHFATLTDIGIVVLFGPETPQLWRPLGDRVTVLYRNLGCSPCFSVYNGRQSQCRRNACMDIRPEEVYEAVRQHLANHPGKAGAVSIS